MKYPQADVIRDAALIVYANRVSEHEGKLTSSRIICDKDLSLRQCRRLLDEIKRQAPLP